MKPGLSLCMIVRDEEATLARCLESARAVCDEILLVDTGSVDSTPQIAERFGARVLEFSWRDDFSAARNFSIQQASCEWILQLDADEFIDGADRGRIRRAITQPDVDAFQVRILNELPSGGVGTLFFPRLFRNGRGFHYEGIVHNQLRIDGRIEPSGIRIHHTGYADPDGAIRRYERSAPLLERQIASEPENPLPLYNLAILCHHRGSYADGARHARRAAELLESGVDANTEPGLAAVLDILGLCLQGCEQWEESARVLGHALDQAPDFPDALFDLAMTRERQGDREAAIHLYERFLETYSDWIEEQPTACSMIRSVDSAHVVWNNLGCLYRASGDVERARRAYSEALALRPDLATSHANRGNLEADTGNLELAEKHYRAALSLAGERGELLRRLGLVLGHLGRKIEAKIVFDRLTQLQPEDPEAWYNLGLTCLTLQEPRHAIDHFERTLELAPQHPAARQWKDRLCGAG